MKIAVIAANGRSDQAFIRSALKAGHEVKAGVHLNNANKAAPKASDNLTWQRCDATKQSDVEDLIQGQDAVVTFIGHVKGSEPKVQTNAMKVVVATMDRLNQKRLVSLTGTGVRFSGDKITIIDRILNFSISIIDPVRVKDGQDHVKVLMDSDMDWTVIRVLKLSKGKPTNFTLLKYGPTKPYVAREEVAQAVLEVLEQNSYLKSAPIIGKTSK